MKSFFEKIGSWFKKFFGTAGAWDKIALNALTLAAPILNETIETLDPAIEPEVGPILTDIQHDMALAATLIQTGQATPTLSGVLNDITTNLGAIEKVSGVKNSSSASKITNLVTQLSAEVQAILGVIQTLAPAAAAAPVAKV